MLQNISYEAYTYFECDSEDNAEDEHSCETHQVEWSSASPVHQGDRD